MSYRTIRNLKKAVGDMLRDNPNARNSDITLMIALWKRFCPDRIVNGEYVRLNDLYDLPREDNIKRVRAYWQNEKKLYLPTDEAVAKARNFNMDEWRVAMGYPTASSAGTPKPSWTPPSERGRLCHECGLVVSQPVSNGADGNCPAGGTHHTLFQ